MGLFSDKLRAALGIHPIPVPALLKGYSLIQLINWYETNLADIEIFDPRRHQVVFDLSRFAYL